MLDSKQNAQSTLDVHHTIHLQRIHQMQLEHERSLRLFSETSDKIAKLNLQKNNGKLSEKDMDLYIKLLDKRLDLVDKINKSKEGIDLTSYYINTSDILFKYYDLVEKGQK
jgi:hypothetical protein